MRPLVFSWALSLAVTLCVGCGDDRPSGTAGNDSSLVGGPCMNNTECDERLCQMGDRFPGGVCTISCGSSGHCPKGSSCAELSSGWICLVDCTTGTDCRTGWGCESVPEAGTSGSLVSVCIGPESAT